MYAGVDPRPNESVNYARKSNVAACRQNGTEPLMYSQFCYYIQQEEQRCGATMHIPRKPGEQIEVDWAGDSAYMTDPDTGEATLPTFS